METTESIKIISKKIKLDFKDSNYATGRRKNLLQEYGLKKAQVKFM